MPDRFMTAAEVASLLRVSRQTVYNWAHDGTIPAVRIAGTEKVTFRFERDGIEKWLAEQQGASA